MSGNSCLAVTIVGNKSEVEAFVNDAGYHTQ